MASTVLKTAPSVEPLSLAEAKSHLRVDDTSEDTLITDIIVAARNYVENVTKRQLVTATWTHYLDAFAAEIRLPYPPLQSVTSVKYYDTGGSQQTLASAVYTTDTYRQRGRLVEAYGQTWPATQAIINAVAIEYVAGYGDAGSDVPSAIRQAMRLLIGHWHENREDVAIGTISTQVGRAVDALLAPYRMRDF
jgi:uncharacterized phiE125 gp8 family phage protein